MLETRFCHLFQLYEASEAHALPELLHALPGLSRQHALPGSRLHRANADERSTFLKVLHTTIVLPMEHSQKQTIFSHRRSRIPVNYRLPSFSSWNLPRMSVTHTRQRPLVGKSAAWIICTTEWHSQQSPRCEDCTLLWVLSTNFPDT